MVENYDESSSAKDAEFVEQIAARLRAPEKVLPSFENRLMEKVRAESGVHLPASASSGRSWWRAERVFRVTPLSGLAIAAGISLIIGVSGVAIGSRISAHSLVSNRPASPVPGDTIQVVRFVFVDPGATRVELVGDFNEWAKGTTELSPSGAPGVWAVSVPLSPGRHEYAFIINGSRWVADPLAVKSSDDFGTESSVIRVGTPANSAT